MDQIPKLADLFEANSFNRCLFEDSFAPMIDLPTAFASPVFYGSFVPERIDGDPIPALRPTLPKNADLWFECDPASDELPAPTLRKASFASVDDSRWVSGYSVS